MVRLLNQQVIQVALLRVLWRIGYNFWEIDMYMYFFLEWLGKGQCKLGAADDFLYHQVEKILSETKTNTE